MDYRKIDRLVEEHVMGNKTDDFYFVLNKQGLREGEIPCYTASYDDAWKVVKRIQGSRFSTRKRFINELQKLVTPEDSIKRGTLVHPGWVLFFLKPVDICLAALKALGIEAEDGS